MFACVDLSIERCRVIRIAKSPNIEPFSFDATECVFAPIFGRVAFFIFVVIINAAHDIVGGFQRRLAKNFGNFVTART